MKENKKRHIFSTKIKKIQQLTICFLFVNTKKLCKIILHSFLMMLLNDDWVACVYVLDSHYANKTVILNFLF